MPWLFLFVTLVGFAFTTNAFFPSGYRRLWHLPSFFASWLTIELAGIHLAWQLVATVVFVELGALEAWPGWAGLVLSAGSWAGLVVLLMQGRSAHQTIATTLAGFVRPGHLPSQTPIRTLVMPLPVRPAHVTRLRDVIYGRVAGRELRLDVYSPAGQGHRRPAIVQIHGGAWVIGDKRHQGLPLMIHMCERGWIGFNVNYRLSPGATFPDHLVDIKRAIAWIRAHADEYGVDPDLIVVTGGSAGGHLAAMAALTANDRRYQPGFEEADVAVQGCVPVYGVYDLANRLGAHSPGYVSRFVGPLIIKAFYEVDTERFHEASPIDRVHPGAPPFFVIHGDRDTMSPLVDAELFVERLSAISDAPVLLSRVAGAQHAFDVLLSPRSAPVVEGIGAFCDEIRLRQQREATPATDAIDGAAHRTHGSHGSHGSDVAAIAASM